MKPIAYLHRHVDHTSELSFYPLTPDDKKYGWTETPLVAAQTDAAYQAAALAIPASISVPSSTDDLIVRRNMADALEWYAEQAAAAARHSIVQNANAMAAIVQVLALDAGDRAKRALTPVAKEKS